MEQEVVKPDAPADSPPNVRGLIVATDGTVVQIQHQTCSDIELRRIGQCLMATADERERKVIAANAAAKAKLIPSVEPPKET